MRLAGVDAPERSQAYGQRAREVLSGLCYRQMARIEQTDTRSTEVKYTLTERIRQVHVGYNLHGIRDAVKCGILLT